MAVGVGGEILPETLEKMVDNCGAIFVDIQTLIRVFDTNDRVSSEEAIFMDMEKVRQWCGKAWERWMRNLQERRENKNRAIWG
ncbi:inositol 3-kinase [Gossypium australe]|uniref:Inositol 3-kinase n=1 Tax=Gossypium australe TaxID=47621 RepID=A0A5B6X7V4_9ROSI|nr:inositol 3-kinase [Gossypium australe]